MKMNIAMVECHQCFGTGKDQDAVNADSFPDYCFNCNGKGHEIEGGKTMSETNPYNPNWERELAEQEEREQEDTHD